MQAQVLVRSEGMSTQQSRCESERFESGSW